MFVVWLRTDVAIALVLKSSAVLNSNSSTVYKCKANIMILRMSDLTLGFLALIDQFLALIDQISYS